MAQSVLALTAEAASISLPARILLGVLTIGGLVVFGAALRTRYLRHDGGPSPRDEETIDCPRCGVQNRIHQEHCEYCHSPLVGHHPNNDPLNGV